MRAGELRHRLTIQVGAGDAAPSGEPVPLWTDVATVWGSVEPLAGRERFTAMQVQAEISHRIRMRARDLSPSYRIKFGERVFGIVSVLRPKERPVELEVLALEEVA